MPVQLRGHHFLCMLTYRGLGYSPEFVDNMSKKIATIAKGATIELVEGPDDICAGMSKACKHATGHDCAAHDILAMDRVARAAIEQVLKRDLAQPSPIAQAELTRLRGAFADGSIRAACSGCSWLEICNHIASEHFSRTLLLESAP